MEDRIVQVDSDQGSQLSPERRQELIMLAESHLGKIDFSDIPSLPDEAWKDAEIGRFYRGPKQSAVVPIDAEIVSWFKSQEGDFQSRINEVLRKEMQSHQADAVLKKTA